MDGCRQQTHLPPGSRGGLLPLSLRQNWGLISSSSGPHRPGPSHLASPTPLLFLPQFGVEAERSSGQPCHALHCSRGGRNPAPRAQPGPSLGGVAELGSAPQEVAPLGHGQRWPSTAQGLGQVNPPPLPVLRPGHKAGEKLLGWGPRTHRQLVQATTTCPQQGTAQLQQGCGDLCSESEAGGGERLKCGPWTMPRWPPDNATITEGTYTKGGLALQLHTLGVPIRHTDPGLLSSTSPRAIQPWLTLHCCPQKYNADYDLSARQGADTLAFMCLLEEKLLPALIHTFWVDAKNYVEHTRKWYAEAIPFPLNFFLPNRMHKQRLERLQLLCGDDCLEDEERLEKVLYHEARECLTLLSQRLGAQKFFFGDSPASLDAFIFSHLAPLFKAKLPNGKLQQHLKSLENLCNYCTSILSLYFPWDGGKALVLTDLVSLEWTLVWHWAPHTVLVKGTVWSQSPLHS
uniref:Metaxin-1 n=1 Tax=Crocodylus porosus TaxID=8502 RepID=A0A7M4FSL3_CROPO